MCAKKLVTASRCEDVSDDKTSSPAPGNTVRSGYRVLRAVMGRPIPRSVNRDCASRKAFSGLKVSSPDKQLISVVAMRVCRSEATPGDLASTGTTGVQVHGEFRRRLLELGRSLKGRARLLRFDGQGLISKSKIIPIREVRESHSSVELGNGLRNEVG
jgi:hypothetical protein